MALLRIVAAAFTLLFAASVALGNTDARPNVLVVLSYHVGMPWADGVAAGLGRSLSDSAEVVITQLDIKRFPEEGRESTVLNVLRSKVEMCKPAVVIAIDDFAYHYVLRHRQFLPPGTPIVFGGVNYWDGVRPSGVTGVVELPEMNSSLELIWGLHPQAQRLVVLNDRTETGLANQRALELALDSGLHGRQVVYLGGGTFEETEERLTRLDPVKDVVFLLSWNMDSTGRPRSYETAIDRARAFSPSPLHGVWGFYFGRGLLGGVLISAEIHGEEVGRLTKRVLAGEPPDTIPVVTRCQTQTMLDDRELRRFSVPYSSLPADAEIRYRARSFWRSNAQLITVAGLIILLQGATITWLAVTRGHRRRAEALLRDSQENLRSTLDSIEEGVIVTDLENNVTRLNPAAENLIGIVNEEAKGKPLSDAVTLLDPQSKQPLALPSAQKLLRKENGVPVNAQQRALLAIAGNPDRLVVHSASAMRDLHGVARGAVVVLRDITAQAQLEDQLQQAQKMESIGQFAGGIAHDFNNILAVIVGYGELLTDQLADRPESLRDLKTMLQGAKRAADLVQQILTFSRKNTPEMAPILLPAVIRDSLKFLRSTVPSSIEIASHLSPDVPYILGDSTQIHQVLMNLCSNALHAMRGRPGRMEIRIDGLEVRVDDTLEHAALEPGIYARMSVSDTGHGMNANTRRRLFEPFFTTKGPGEGTGLGLSVVHGIVEAHRGKIVVHSRPGEGSVFLIYFPALSASTVHESKKPAPIMAGQGQRILFVDDEPDIGAATRRLAEHVGYKVDSFQSPQEALAHLRQHAHTYDLLLTDLTMPVMSGLELACAAHEIRPDLPVVLTTGYAAGVTEQEARKCGVTHVLVKPFTVAAFANALHAVFAAKSK